MRIVREVNKYTYFDTLQTRPKPDSTTVVH